MKVRIKTWEKMAEQYGYLSGDALDIPGTFINIMEEKLPADRIIEVSAEQDRGGNRYFIWGDADADVDFKITEEMIEEFVDAEPDLKEGQQVRIRKWDDMVREYGLFDHDTIGVPGGFSRFMERALPEDRIITLEKYNYSFYWSGYTITPSMIERVIEKRYLIIKDDVIVDETSDVKTYIEKWFSPGERVRAVEVGKDRWFDVEKEVKEVLCS